MLTFFCKQGKLAKKKVEKHLKTQKKITRVKVGDSGFLRDDERRHDTGLEI